MKPAELNTHTHTHTHTHTKEQTWKNSKKIDKGAVFYKICEWSSRDDKLSYIQQARCCAVSLIKFPVTSDP